MTDRPLVAAFRAAHPSGASGWDDALIARAVEEMIAAGRVHWPSVDIPLEAFVPFVAARAATAETLEPERGPDLWLACGCARGDVAALAAFEAAIMVDLRGALAKLRLDPVTQEEAAQKIRAELFVAEPGKRPKIAEYSGRGDLRGWFRVTAVRSALKLLRSRKRDGPSADEQLLEQVRATDVEPEVWYVKELYRPAFKLAFQDALDALPPRDQNLLRQHYVDGLTVDQLAPLYAVHRATAARWVASAREALLKHTRRRFMERVRVSRTECDSIMRLLHSQLGMTIQRRLAAAGDKPSD